MTLAQHWQRHRRWIVRDVLVPFIISRALLVGIGWFAQLFPLDTRYPTQAAVERGWEFTPNSWLDNWARWDSGFYLGIATHGYRVQGDPTVTQSNIAFFPLYPYLVRGLAQVIPPALRSTGVIIAIGVGLSNVCLLGALIVLHRLIMRLLDDEGVAQRAVWLVLIFPTSFFLSAFYSEALFLLLSIAALYAAYTGRWTLAGGLSAAATLTRPQALLLLLPLALIYLDSIGWRVRRAWRALGWLSLSPLALLAHLLSLMPITHNLWLPLMSHGVWGRTFSWPWQSFLTPNTFIKPVTQFEQVLLPIMLSLAVWALIQRRTRVLGIYALMVTALPLFSGSLLSTARYFSTLFPAFIVLAQLGRRPLVQQTVNLLAIALQALLMAGFSRLYPIY
ncbi:MAG: hypothetical protein KA765_05900 [Thermoflexales bacterium]|nr:hypothetical protein [Thermoflexales bacterium]